MIISAVGREPGVPAGCVPEGWFWQRIVSCHRYKAGLNVIHANISLAIFHEMLIFYRDQPIIQSKYIRKKSLYRSR